MPNLAAHHCKFWLRALPWILTIWVAIGLPIARAATIIAAGEQFPLSYMADGKPTGMLVDMVSAAFERAGLPLEIRILPWARCLAAARNGSIDGVFPANRTIEREAYLDYSEQYLIRQRISLFARPDSPISSPADLDSLSGLVVGIVNATALGHELDQRVRDGRLPRLEMSNSIDALVKMLARGRVDVIAGGQMAIEISIRRQNLENAAVLLTPPLEDEPGFLAYSRVTDHGEIRAEIDAALLAMKNDGTYQRIQQRYAEMR